MAAATPFDRHLLERARRAQAGERGAISALTEEVRPRIQQQLLRYPIIDEDRQDVLQKTLLQIFRRIGSFRGDSSFSTWVFRVTANEALMLMRSRRARHARLVEGLELDELGSLGAESGAAAEHHDHALAEHERHSWLEGALTALEPLERELIVAHYYSDLDLHEIAERFHLTEPAVRSRMHRARRRLRRVLEEERAGRLDG